MRNREGEAMALRKALLNVFQVLGPKPLGDCRENKCKGCRYEMEDARLTVHDTLKRFGLLPGSHRWRPELRKRDRLYRRRMARTGSPFRVSRARRTSR